ncbi:hypothetical protein ASD38_14040 [Caulobacter sp. Root487D2Y]|uniref:DUF805 domain-containing protein n=1 Tax=Caulobacter sp. Root487D2Y TaxID=1736547 RepID=UPI0006F2D201|nr:DUF805 domain-containing protein [Caulobacter sp. Root487D2Y]KQY28765.1 hypothetical protein ASD38_14040 [Caulobacter sp. Root487D2Y]
MGFLKGRTNRATYWLSLGVIGVLIAITVLVFHTQVKISEILLIWVCVPRLHDIGRSGWIAGGVFLTEIVVAVGVVFLIPDPDMSAAGLGVVVLVIAALLIWLGCIPGHRTTNAFGDPPGRGIGIRPKSSSL